MKSPTWFVAGALLAFAPLVHAGAGGVSWNNILRQPDAWYATADARRIATNIVDFQSSTGGWPKNTDMTVPPVSADRNSSSPGTIDNNSTTTQLEYLAKIVSAAEKPADVAQFKKSFDKGFDYLLEAQYPNGGWPQYFPLRDGYYTHITFNDNATARVLTLLDAAATGKTPYAFVEKARREKAAAAVAKGLECILKTQIKVDGKLTVWCAQHDEKTLAPAKARAYELPSFSGSESVGLVRFLMTREQPSPEIIASVRGAVKWFEAAQIKGIRVQAATTDGAADRVVVADLNAPAIWARFYDLDTGKAIFVGRDGVKKPALADIEQERRRGYAYYGNWPAQLIEVEYPAWEKKISGTTAVPAAAPAAAQPSTPTPAAAPATTAPAAAQPR